MWRHGVSKMLRLGFKREINLSWISVEVNAMKVYRPLLSNACFHFLLYFSCRALLHWIWKYLWFQVILKIALYLQNCKDRLVKLSWHCLLVGIFLSLVLFSIETRHFAKFSKLKAVLVFCLHHHREGGWHSPEVKKHFSPRCLRFESFHSPNICRFI